MAIADNPVIPDTLIMCGKTNLYCVAGRAHSYTMKAMYNMLALIVNVLILATMNLSVRRLIGWIRG